MKQIFTIFLCSVLLVFGACQSQKGEVVEETSTEPFEVSAEEFLYEGTKDIDAIAVDEEGYLYTVTCITELEEDAIIDASTYSSFIQQFKVYDLEGTCVNEVELTFGTGNMNLLSAKDGTLYCIAMKSELATWGPTLYTIDTKTWELTEVYQFENYSNIINFSMIGDYVYVIGYLKEVPEKEYTLHPDIDTYEYRGECISRIKLGKEKIQEEIIPTDFPIDIVTTKKDTLLIYHYNEENGFGFLEFNPKEATLTEVGWRKNQNSIVNLTQCKDGFLFLKGGSIYYGTVNNVESRLSKNEVAFMGNFAYQRGFLFYMRPEGVERMGVNDLIKNNTTIQMLVYDKYTREPYDNGYRVEKTIIEPENYALKVLAQDSDFDMYLLESREFVSYNLKEKGAFYALNEVPGVQEYLDACFPYIKEVATNENGDIWMIPVESAIFSLLYHKEYSRMQEVDVSTMDLFEFLDLVEQIGVEEPEKGSVSTYMIIENLFLQYLNTYDSFDTEIFRKYAEKVRRIQERAGTLANRRNVISIKTVTYGPNDIVYTQEELEKIPYFLYEQGLYVNVFMDSAERLGTSDIIGATNYPLLSKESGNIGTVTFLAVNPQAENLEVTLDYISDLCKYMVSQKDTFLLKDETLYTDTPIIKEYYEVYKGGEIAFAMDSNVYWKDFWNYIYGEMELEELVEGIERKRKIYVGE